jgi:CHAT domain-containing protein
VYYTLGLIYQYTGNYQNSDSSFQKSRDGYTAAFGAKHPYVAAALYGLGETAKLRGDHKAAKGFFNDTLEIYTSIYGENHPYVGTVYYALAYECHFEGDLSKSVTYYLRAIELYRQTYGERSSFTAIAYYGLGRVLSDSGDAKRALEYLEKARDIDLEIFGEEHINTIATLFGIAGLLDKTGRIDEASAVMNRTLLLQKKVLGEEHPDTAHSYIELGRYLSLKGKNPEALDQYRRALDVSKKSFGESHPVIARLYNLIGNVYFQMKDFVQAEKYFYTAQDIARKWEVDQSILESSGNLAKLKMSAGDYLSARKYYDQNRSVIERLRSAADAERSEIMSSGLHFYYQSLNASVMLGDADAVFSVAESMKARGFLDRISLDAALSADGVGVDDRKRMLELNEKIAALISRRREKMENYKGSADMKILSAIGRELEDAGKEFTLIDAKLLKNSSYRRLRKANIATLREAQTLCDDTTAILEYILDYSSGEKEGKAYCLVIKKQSKKIIVLDGSYAFNESASKFRSAVIEPNRGRERERLSGELYGKLLKPLEAELAGMKKIIIIPDGNLSSLPFDALRPDANSPYLCERYTVTLGPSVSVLLMTRERRFTGRRSSLLAFGGAYYSDNSVAARSRGVRSVSRDEPGPLAMSDRLSQKPSEYYRSRSVRWGNIPGTLEEVRDISAVSNAKKDVRIITGADVNESVVKKMSRMGELAAYRTIHFACHGYFDPDRPAFSSVILSEVSGSLKSGEDGYLSVPEVASLKLQADVVTLSACETGLGTEVQGDGVVGLTRAFQEAGASSVHVTLWQVDDDATKRFMISLYRKTVSGLPLSKAAAETKKEFILSKEFGDPYFWSSFVLYGE